jgi:hypothetical protein
VCEQAANSIELYDIFLCFWLCEVLDFGFWFQGFRETRTRIRIKNYLAKENYSQK